MNIIFIHASRDIFNLSKGLYYSKLVHILEWKFLSLTCCIHSRSMLLGSMYHINFMILGPELE